MVADFKERIDDELHGFLRMRIHPFPSDKEGRMDVLTAQSVDDRRIIAGYLIRTFTEVKGQRYDFAVLYWLHPAYGVGRPGSQQHRGHRSRPPRWEERHRQTLSGDCDILRVALECVRGPQTLQDRLGAKRQLCARPGHFWG